MHYRNGREAKNGDEIVQINEKGQITDAGVLIRATPGNDYCNGVIANDRSKSFVGACMCDCLHIEDVAAMLKEKGLEKRRPVPPAPPAGVLVRDGEQIPLAPASPQVVS